MTKSEKQRKALRLAFHLIQTHWDRCQGELATANPDSVKGRKAHLDRLYDAMDQIADMIKEKAAK